MPNDEERNNQIRKLLSEAEAANDGSKEKKKAAPKRKRSPPRKKPEIKVAGNQNFTIGSIGRDANFRTERVIHKTNVSVTPGHVCITEAQKVRLDDLRKEWMRLSRLVRRRPISYQAAWSAIAKKGGVKSSYHLIPIGNFPRVEKWLLLQIALLNGTATARKRSPSWRTARIRAIQARCNEKGLQEWRKQYMADRFGKPSMVDLGDEELEVLYRAIMAK